jgi:hypothetical protein
MCFVWMMTIVLTDNASAFICGKVHQVKGHRKQKGTELQPGDEGTFVGEEDLGFSTDLDFDTFILGFVGGIVHWGAKEWGAAVLSTAHFQIRGAGG